jgi:hypothetical protein
MAQRKGGAGPKLSEVLEQPRPSITIRTIDRDGLETDVCPSRRIKGRTIYLPDDLFERILVQAHRRDRTISEYVTGILERQVPNHRTTRVESAGDPAEAGAA